jgi:hypothetical protein
MAEYRVGCSGWIYPHWAGLFYPEDLPEREWFDFYAKVFNTVEVNATFYRFPTEKMVQAWYRKGPEGFLFTLKAFRGITHLRKFQGTEELLRRFYAMGEMLGEKLGACGTTAISFCASSISSIPDLRTPWNSATKAGSRKRPRLFCGKKALPCVL